MIVALIWSREAVTQELDPEASRGVDRIVTVSNTRAAPIVTNQTNHCKARAGVATLRA
jgi:hypothetical protein